MGVNFAEAALATGHEVAFSYARSTQKLKRLAKDARGKALART
jgi:hypothetical protein